MKTLTTNGIILKRTSYNDADRILTIYTEDLGKITGLAKGIRKMKSKKRGDLELFNNTKLHLAKGKTWYIVTQTELIDDFNNIKLNSNTTTWAFFIAEVFERFTNEEEENDRLYNFMIKTFKSLDLHNDNFHIVNAFLIKILNMSGFFNQRITEKTSSKIEKEYINTLLNEKFDIINKLTNEIYSTELANNINKLITNQTEEILGKRLKTKIQF